MNKNHVYIALFAFLSVFTPFFADAGNPSLVKSQSVLNGPGWSFKENKGQLMDENHKPLNDIPYYGKQGGVNIYCKAGMVSFVFVKTENDAQVSEATGSVETPIYGVSAAYQIRDKSPSLQKSATATRADLVFLNSNPAAEITASEKQSYYENYYTTGDADHGITNVRTYKTITYKDIYPHIDLVLQAGTGPAGLVAATGYGMEYSFIVHPGGNVADIQLQWNGLNDIKQLENGGIAYSLPNSTTSLREGPTESSLTTAVGDLTRNPLVNTTPAPTFTETPPVCYLAADNFSKVSNFGKVVPTIPSSFTRHASRISFSVPHYDKSKTLVIDPTLSWGTYFGGGSDVGYGITHDFNNNIYIAGAAGGSGIATSGAYQTSIGGYIDAFVAKFTTSGSLSWGTYYGGSNGATTAYGITTDTNNNVYITGYTASANGITTSGAYQTNFIGSQCIFMAKFTSSGSLLWGTYYGGGNDDVGKSIISDADNNVYITGTTSETSSVATSGTYQTRYAGNGDAFVAKFTSSGSLTWGTYYGGSGNDGGYGIAIDHNKNIYITGSTNSTSGIATAGAYQTIYGGGGSIQNPFIAKFTSTGSLSWATYYGRSNGSGQGNGITTDANNNVYITGYTGSYNGITTTGAYQTSLAGNYDAFVAKFTSSGSLSWGTYYGGINYDYGQGINIDINNNVNIIGITLSTSGIATSDAYLTSFVGLQDIFVAKFDSSGNSLIWGTYYGGGDNDEGIGITTDTDNIYITGTSGSTSGIATSNAYQTSVMGKGDAFIAKFNSSTKTGIPQLYQNVFNLKISPNPFTSYISISYSLPQNQNVQLTITDITGKQIAILTNENQGAGLHTFTFDAATYNIPAGVYFLHMIVGGETIEEKIVRIIK